MGLKIIIFAGVVFLIFSFITGRSAQKKQTQRQTQLMQEMKPGDWVMTQSGFYGKFVELDGEVVILENEDGVESYWSQAAIAMLKNPPFAHVAEEAVEIPAEDNYENGDDQVRLEEKLTNSESSIIEDEESK